MCTFKRYRHHQTPLLASLNDYSHIAQQGKLATEPAAVFSGSDVNRYATNQHIAESQLQNNYLSELQIAQKKKELAACDGIACQLKVHLKWLAIDEAQDKSLVAGVVVGIPANLYESGADIVGLLQNPGETYDALKTLIRSDDAFVQVSASVKRDYIDHINRLQAEYERAGAAGSFKAGIEAGKLLTEIAGLGAGGVGLAKTGTKLTAKVVGKGTPLSKIDFFQDVSDARRKHILTRHRKGLENPAKQNFLQTGAMIG